MYENVDGFLMHSELFLSENKRPKKIWEKFHAFIFQWSSFCLPVMNYRYMFDYENQIGM